jgi:hypothetical protein
MNEILPNSTRDGSVLVLLLFTFPSPFHDFGRLFQEIGSCNQSSSLLLLILPGLAIEVVSI